jgi:multiple sugar transport system permease protein
VIDNAAIGRRITAQGRTLAAVLATAVFLLPIAFLIAGAVHQIGLPPSGGYDWLPNPATLENFTAAQDSVALEPGLRNSLFVVVIALPLSLVIASMAGFAIATAPRRFRAVVLSATVVAVMTPSTALWIPRFALYDTLGLTDTIVPLVLPALIASTPIAVLLFALAYWRVPTGVVDAARVDGIRPLALWWRVMVPLGRPATYAAVLVTFLFHWSSYAEPLLVITDRRRETAAIVVGQLGAVDFAKLPVALAGALLFTLPALAVFVVAQRALFAPQWTEGVR